MDSSVISVVLLGLAVLFLIVWIVLLEKRINNLTGGKNSTSLEDTINANQKAIADLYAFRQEVNQTIGKMDTRIQKKLHGVKTVRFNPFAGTGSGGNQSFASALLDENGDGVVISSLYSREKVSIFAKPIKARVSEFELTEEEQEVLK